VGGWGSFTHMEQKWSYSESLSESVDFLLIDQSKTANDRESHFGLSYQKLSMGSEGDDPEIDTFALIYWNHFFEAGPFLFHMVNLCFSSISGFPQFYLFVSIVCLCEHANFIETIKCLLEDLI